MNNVTKDSCFKGKRINIQEFILYIHQKHHRTKYLMISTKKATLFHHWWRLEEWCWKFSYIMGINTILRCYLLYFWSNKCRLVERKILILRNLTWLQTFEHYCINHKTISTRCEMWSLLQEYAQNPQNWILCKKPTHHITVWSNTLQNVCNP